MNITPRFLDLLRLEKIGEADGRPIFRLLSEFRYDSAVAGCRIAVPAGFVTDLASVPRLPVIWWLTGDTAHEAALVHDFLYQTRLPVRDQEEADAVFYEAMEVMGVPGWRRWMMWRGVRRGGGAAWASGPSRYRVLNAA